MCRDQLGYEARRVIIANTVTTQLLGPENMGAVFLYLSCNPKVEINVMGYLNTETSSEAWAFCTGPNVQQGC